VHSRKSAYTIPGYYGPEMRRDVYLMMVAFWTSVPLLAVSLAVSWSQRELGWPGAVLWVVVLASSAYLTVRLCPLFPREGEGSESHAEARQTLETLVYPIVFVFSGTLLGFQTFPF
jgi:NADH:ubiquinone oxidoreductase subunit 5 (subunit L)/multisubunit Na+/H+ antiporter MnhA subunit